MKRRRRRRMYLFGAESAGSSQPGATPRFFRSHSERALKARFNSLMNRALALKLESTIFPGALPQVRHGESVLWRTGDE